jgi:hypothetical protein
VQGPFYEEEMLMVRTVVAGLALVALAGLGPAAQEETPQPSKYTNVKWYEITNVDYYPAKAEKALELVFDHFVPAVRAAGIEAPRIMEYATGGEWDLTVIFPLKEGPSEMEWELSPDGAKWIAALVEHLGGMEEFEKLMEDYHSMVHRYDIQIVRERDTGWSSPAAATR